MAAQLTPGAVAVVSDHADGRGTLQPVLQVMDVRIVTNQKNPSSQERFRMVLSDGVHTLQSMLATSLNPLHHDGSIKSGSIVQLQEFNCSTIHTRRIIIVIRLDVLQSECAIIGNPKPYDVRIQPNEQGTNFPANAAQANTGTYSSGPGMLGSSAPPRPLQDANNIPYGSSAAPRPVQGANNVPYSGSDGGYQGTVAPPIGRAVESIPNVASGVSYGTTSAHNNTTNVGMVQPNLQQPSLNYPENQSFAVPSMVGGCGAPGNTYGQPAQSNLQQPPLNSHENQRFAVPSMAGGSDAPGNTYGQPAQSNLQQPSLNSHVNQRFAVPSSMVGGSGAPGNTYGQPAQSNLQQPSLNSHENQRFAVPSMAGGSGAPGNTYGQPAQSFYQQPPVPGHMNRAPVSKNDASRLVPVAQLNPYQYTWTIKARVTAKTGLRHYSNKRGAGKVFSFDLLDAQGGEIRVTCFNVQADQFFDLIEVDKVYLISRGTLKEAQKQFNSLNHEYEITLESKSSIEVCVDDDSSIPRQQYNFRQISEIESIEENALVDLIGIVTSVAPSATITRKDGSEAQKRTLQLKDMSGRSVEITLWGKFCAAEGQQLQSQCDSGLNPVLALKGARISGFNGRSVNSTASTQLKINPHFAEAESLRQWYATEGKTAACVPLSVISMGRTDVRKAVAQIKDENLGRSEKPDFITVKGAISHLITDNFCYPACTLEVNGRVCSKKVINNGDGTWQCDKCDQSLQKCEYRYLLQCQIQDHTGVTYATAFQEAGVEIVGHSAYELYSIREEDPERFAEILQGVRWQQFLFKLKVFEETYNDEQRVKCNILRAEKLDLAKESYYLLGVINGLLQDDTGSPSKAQGAMAYNAGISNTGAGRSVPTSNSGYTTNMSGPRYGGSTNQSAQQANAYTGASTPGSVTRDVQTCPASMYKQQPASSTASSYGSFQPHNAGLAPAPQQQQYRSGGTSLGGYDQQQPYLGATNY